MRSRDLRWRCRATLRRLWIACSVGGALMMAIGAFQWWDFFTVYAALLKVDAHYPIACLVYDVRECGMAHIGGTIMGLAFNDYRVFDAGVGIAVIGIAGFIGEAIVARSRRRAATA